MQIYKPCDKKSNHNDVITKKQWKNADVRETNQLYYPKMPALSNLSNFVKSYGHLSEIMVFLPQALIKYG